MEQLKGGVKMITIFQYGCDSSLNQLLDDLLGTTLSVGSHRGMLPDYATVREMRGALRKFLRKNLIESESLDLDFLR